MKKLKSAGVENADAKVHWDSEEITWVAVSDVQVSNFSYQVGLSCPLSDAMQSRVYGMNNCTNNSNQQYLFVVKFHASS